jgi:YVTN family beta-propeller protein
MHSDEILQLDVASFRIARRAKTGEGHVMASTGPAHQGPAAPLVGGVSKECSPTFISVSRDDKRLYVACNYGNSLQVWDAATLTLTKEIPVGKGAYNVEPSPDGKLVLVTNKKEQSVSLVDAVKLTEIARIPTSKKIVHGVAYSPDGRLAYVSSESIGADPGAVDVIDLAARKLVGSVSIPGQPTGITVLQTPSPTARR